MTITTILLALEYPTMAKAIVSVLENCGYEICSICTNNTEAYRKIIELKPTISVLSISSSDMNALKIMKKLKESDVETNVIIKTSFKGLGLYKFALTMGVKGYLLKTDSIEEFEKCLELVAKGEKYVKDLLKAD